MEDKAEPLALVDCAFGETDVTEDDATESDVVADGLVDEVVLGAAVNNADKDAADEDERVCDNIEYGVKVEFIHSALLRLVVEVVFGESVMY